MITAAQIRAARGLLGWTQADLAQEAGVVRRTLNAAETETATTKPETLAKIRAAFEANGVRFLKEGEAIGVMLRPHRKAGENTLP